MKRIIFSVILLCLFSNLSAQTFSTSKPAFKFSRVSAEHNDRFFYVSYRYTDACGVGRVGVFVCSSMHAYPGQSDLLLHAASFTCGDHHCIQITGVDAICKADFNALSK